MGSDWSAPELCSTGAQVGCPRSNVTLLRALVMYEPPFIVDSSRPPLPRDYVEHLDELIAAGRRGEAVEYFMTAAVGVPAEISAGMRNTPMWPGLEAAAHTIAYWKARRTKLSRACSHQAMKAIWPPTTSAFRFPLGGVCAASAVRVLALS